MSTSYEKHLQTELKRVSDEAQTAAAEMEEKFKTDGEVPSDLKEQFDNLVEQGRKMRESLEQLQGLSSLDDFVNAPEEKRSGEIITDARLIQPQAKTLGQRYVESESYQRAAKSSRPQGMNVGFEAKATFTTTASGLDSTVMYQPGIILVEQQRLMIRDLLATGQTTMNAVPYVQEDTFTNAATTVAEGATKPEATFDTSAASAPVKKVAVTAKVTDELWADFPALQSYIDDRLRFMVLQEEEDQLLNGDGVGANMTGILNTTGIQTQALGADTRPDAIHKGITKIRSVGFFEPDGIVINPNDWEDLRLLKDGNSQYYGGGPFTGAYGNNGLVQNSIWGLPAVITTAIAAGTALVGAFQLGAQVFFREGIRMDSTNSNQDDFVKNLITIRVEERLALAVYRPKAFCTITGI